MIKLIRYFLLLIIISISSLVQANSYTAINYTITPNLTQKTPCIKIDTEIKGQMNGKIVLTLPYIWGGAKHYKQIKNFRLISPKGTIQFKKARGNQAIITVPKTKTINLSYEIKQKPGDPTNVHENIIRKDLIHVIGYGVFAVPNNIKNRIAFTITWKNLQQGWKTISSYGTNSCMNFATADPSQLLQSVYIAGQLRVLQIASDNNPIYLSLYGGFDFADNVIASNLGEIIKTQRSFFNDNDFPFYFISLIEGNDPYSFGGTGLHTSFAAYLPKDINKLYYYILFAHEHLHNWIGGKIHNDESEELNYWWSEGFTDYYSRVLAWRSGGITTKEFINEYNQFLKNYYLSPVINASNKKIKSDFWKNRDIRKLPYYRGFIFATYINHLIKQHDPNNSLDNVMLDLFKEAKNKKFSAKHFKKIAQYYLPQNIAQEFSIYIDQGRSIKLDDLTSALPLEQTKIGTYDLGFDRRVAAESKEHIIKNINRKSNAYKAGLRNGDKIVDLVASKGIYDLDPDQTITIKTFNKKTVKFRPENLEQKRIVHQFKQNLSSKDLIKIKKFFGAKSSCSCSHFFDR